jgi:hypothetical protein
LARVIFCCILSFDWSHVFYALICLGSFSWLEFFRSILSCLTEEHFNFLALRLKIHCLKFTFEMESCFFVHSIIYFLCANFFRSSSFFLLFDPGILRRFGIHSWFDEQYWKMSNFGWVKEKNWCNARENHWRWTNHLPSWLTF